MRRVSILVPLTLVSVLAVGSGCGGTQEPSTAPTVSTDLGPSTEASPGGDQPASAPAEKSAAPVSKQPSSAPKTSGAPSSGWPSPEDCVSYNPNNLTSHYEAGIYSINDGAKVVTRLHGGPGEKTGEQGLALAKRYRKHCYLGRNNHREDQGSYIFDYWRDASGMKPMIADEEDACSGYDRDNLTVEDMGSGHGWRVKDHDHVLHLFDNASDANNGKMVLVKYSRICFLGDDNDGQQDVANYGL